jgi:O-antigen ligase/tetratricopeptide (TPR) repeat protein
VKLSFETYLFWGILIFSPLAFGSVEPWSLAIMEGGAFLTLFLVLIRKRVIVAVPGFTPLMIFLAYMLFQLIPLPQELVKFISPSAYKIYGETIALVDPGAWMPLTLNRRETLSEFFRYAAYAAFYIAGIQLLTGKRILERTVYILAGFTTLFALFAILQHFTTNGKMLWVVAVPNRSFFGTYVNRNHYAGFIGMLFPVVVSLFLCMKPAVCYTTLRERIVEFFSQFRSNIYVLLGFSSLLIAVSLFLCCSRGGIVSMCIALSFLGGLLAFRIRNLKAGLTLCVLFLLILFSVGWFGWDPIFNRFKGIRDTSGEIKEGRLSIWQDSRGIVDDFPVTGTGFGSFDTIFPAYGRSPEGITFTYSHNDYIELAVDGGIIACLLAGWFLLAVLSRSVRLFLKRHDPFSIYLCGGCYAGVLSILLHSFADYNLRVGANGLIFFGLLGLMVSTAHTRLRGSQQASLLHPLRAFPARWILIPVGILFLGAISFNIGAQMGNGSLSPGWRTLREINSAQNRITGVRRLLDRATLFGSHEPAGGQNEPIDLLHRLDWAIRLDPLNSLYPLLKAGFLLLHADNSDAARPYYEAAIRLKPSDGSYLGELALFYSKKPEQHPLAEKLFLSAIKYHGVNPDGHKEYGLWLLEQGRMEEGLSQLKSAIALAPAGTKSYIDLLIARQIDLADIPKAFPDRVQPYLIYADYLIEKNAQDLAEAIYIKAMGFVQNEEKVKAEWFYPPSRFYEKSGNIELAIGILTDGITLLPENTGLRLKVAALYEKIKITYRAQEEYKKVLLMDPGNREAKKRLAQLNLSAEKPI